MNITEFILSYRERAFLVGDYGSYRAQLSRQLATLRRKLGIATGKNAKYAPKPVTAEEVGSNVE
jgi:signal recognition particle subunit SRP68